MGHSRIGLAWYQAQLVVVEEGVILGPDFLSYLAQLLPLLDLDSTISTISAWNDNGQPSFRLGRPLSPFLCLKTGISFQFLALNLSTFPHPPLKGRSKERPRGSKNLYCMRVMILKRHCRRAHV